MKEKILLTGSSGLVGSRFVELYPDKRLLLTPDEKEFDITDKKKIEDYLSKNEITAIINFAAFTDVGGAEAQRNDKLGSCWGINVKGVRNLVNAVNSRKIHFIQISTDSVFSGSKADSGPYSENHPIERDGKKLTWYGFTKAEGERIAFEKLRDKTTILRLIYPVRAKFEGKLDYLRKPMKLFKEGKLYPMFTDQQVSITFIDEACLALNKIIQGGISGFYHASSHDTTTPFEITSYLIEKTKGIKNGVKPASLDNFLKTVNNPTRYPKYGGLKVEYTQKILKIHFSSWREIVDTLIKQGIGE
jgi:dTDP-4-dehydrorhamnose reductase